MKPLVPICVGVKHRLQYSDLSGRGVSAGGVVGRRLENGSR